MKCQVDRIRAIFRKLERVRLAGKTDLVIFRRRNGRQRRTTEHHRQRATLRIAHLDVALQVKRGHAVAQFSLEVKLIEENPVRINVRLSGGERNLRLGFCVLKTVRARLRRGRLLIRRLAKRALQSGNTIGLGDHEIVALGSVHRDRAGIQHCVALRRETHHIQPRPTLRVRVSKMRTKFHLALDRVFRVEPKHQIPLALLVVAKPPLESLFAGGLDEIPLSVHRKSQLIGFALEDFHRAIQLLLGLSTRVVHVNVGPDRENQFLLLLLLLRFFEIAADDKTGLIASEVTIHLEIINLQRFACLLRLAKRSGYPRETDTQSKQQNCLLDNLFELFHLFH